MYWKDRDAVGVLVKLRLQHWFQGLLDPVQMENGSLVARERGTPQGGVSTP
jgi:hypothetical protein